MTLNEGFQGSTGEQFGSDIHFDHLKKQMEEYSKLNSQPCCNCCKCNCHLQYIPPAFPQYPMPWQMPQVVYCVPPSTNAY